MKTKKLLLNKKTIAHLMNDEMHSVNGGATRTCNTCMLSDVYVCPSEVCTEPCDDCTSACTLIACKETYNPTYCPL